MNESVRSAADGLVEFVRACPSMFHTAAEICRRLDGEVASLPRDSRPAALENWARRRGTLSWDEAERHLGLEDADLMLRTVQAEFNLKDMFAK